MPFILPKPFPSQKEEIVDFSYDRPIGISILSVILLLSNIIFFILEQVYMDELLEASVRMGFSQTGLVTSLYLVTAVGITSGAGLWLGKSWGWWLALFYFAFVMVRNGHMLLFMKDAAAVYSETSVGIGMYVKPVMRILGGGAVLYYLLKESPLIYFCLPETAAFKLRALGQVFGAGLAMLAITAWIHS